MLNHLRVRNLGVIDEAQLDPSSGFTVITGETGAGKTLLLGALRLLTGDKARPDAVGPFGDDAQADGLFTDGRDDLGVTRLVPGSGRSRAYLEGVLVSAPALVERVGPLVEIVGQHDQLRLRRPAKLLELIDRALDDAGRAARDAYGETWDAFIAAEGEQERLGGDRMALERELDLASHQASEIASAGLEADEDEKVEILASRLRNAEAIRAQLGTAIDSAASMSELAGEVVSSLRKVADLDPGLTQATTTAESITEEIVELVRQLKQRAEETSEDPESLAAAEARLTALGELKRKYGRTVAEVIGFGSDALDRSTALRALLDRAGTIEDDLARARERLYATGAALTAARARAGQIIESEAAGHLSGLGMPEAAISVTIEAAPPGPSGADRAGVLFTSDPRLEAGRIEDVASGGELSRLVLALRLASNSEEATTMVFDEVDAGVGGATALALGRKLLDLARTSQVLCVTHLPQVAAHADTHYVVRRAGATAEVAKVEGEERLEELSRMLAGLPESSGSREAAAELLAVARA